MYDAKCHTYHKWRTALRGFSPLSVCWVWNTGSSCWGLIISSLKDLCKKLKKATQPQLIGFLRSIFKILPLEYMVQDWASKAAFFLPFYGDWKLSVLEPNCSMFSPVPLPQQTGSFTSRSRLVFKNLDYRQDKPWDFFFHLIQMSHWTMSYWTVPYCVVATLIFLIWNHFI